MKRIKSLSIPFSITLVLMMFTRCEDIEQFDIANGGKYAAQLSVPTGIDYYFQTTPSVSFDIEIYENEGVSVSSVTATKQLFTAGKSSEAATVDVSGGAFNQTMEQLFADVPVDGNVLTENDLSPGDTWVISYEMTLSDGTQLIVSSSKNTTITFTCISEIEEGEYTASQTNVDWFGTATTKDVTITMESDGVYLISDVSAGGYEACCSSLGYNADQPAVITDVCNAITVTGDGTAQIQTRQGLEIGSYDPATKTIVVHYADAFNDSDGSGIDLYSTFVKK